MFSGTKCGLCCRNIDQIPELAAFDPGNGVCIHLTEDNLCAIYEQRPDICNVETMYQLHFQNIMTREVYDRMNLEGCRRLQKIKKQ